MIKSVGKLISRLFGLNILKILYTIIGVPLFIIDMIKYIIKNDDDKFQLKLSKLFPRYSDRFYDSGVAKGHYFHQDLWAAKLIFKQNPIKHIDIGSRIDGFVSHLLSFRPVTVIDIRPLSSNVEGLTFTQGNIAKLDYNDESIESLSCLHALEHIGLGRYNDEIDPYGWVKGLNELQRVLRIGGKLYLGIPIGTQTLCFNAHRIFDPNTIIEKCFSLHLKSFSFVDDEGTLHNNFNNVQEIPKLDYGCGLYEFEKLDIRLS